MQEQTAKGMQEQPTGRVVRKPRSTKKSAEEVKRTNTVQTQPQTALAEPEVITESLEVQQPDPQILLQATRQYEQQKAVTTRSYIQRQPHPDYHQDILADNNFIIPRPASVVNKYTPQQPRPQQTYTGIRNRAGNLATQPGTRIQEERNYTQAPPRRNTEQIRVPQVPQQEGRQLHKLFYIGMSLIGLTLVMLAIYLYIVVPPAITRWNDDRTYGYPRKYEQMLNVGHGGKSDLLIENLNGTIELREQLIVQVNQDPKPHLYIIATLDPGAKYTPVTFTLVPGRQTGKPDILVTIGDLTIRWYNNGTTYQSHQ